MSSRPDFIPLEPDTANSAPFEPYFLENLQSRYQEARDAQYTGSLYSDAELEYAFVIGEASPLTAHYLKTARWHSQVAEACLHRQLFPGQDPGWEQRAGALEKDLVTALDGGDWMGRLTPSEEITFKILLTWNSQGLDIGETLTLKLQLIPLKHPGKGEIYAALPQAFLLYDSEWDKAQTNARLALQHYGWWPKNSAFDLRWYFPEGQTMPGELTGGSAGALLALMAANFLDRLNRRPSNAIDLTVDPAFLSRVSMTATIDPEGKISPVSLASIKINAVFAAASKSTRADEITTVVVAEPALNEIMGPLLADWNGNRVGNRITYEKIPWTILGVKNLAEAAQALREEVTRHWQPKLSSPPPGPEGIFEIYRHYLQLGPEVKSGWPATVPHWLKSGHGAGFLEICFQSSQDKEVYDFVRVFPLLAKRVIDEKIPLTNEASLANVSTDVSPVMVRHLIKQLQDEAGLTSRLFRSVDRDFRLADGSEIHIKVERYVLGRNSRDQGRFIFPSHLAGHLRIDPEVKELLKKLDSSLTSEAYYIWTIHLGRPASRKVSWTTINHDVGQKLMAMIKEAGRPRPLIFDVANTDNFVSKLKSTFGGFVWSVPSPIKTYQARKQDFTHLSVALEDDDAILVGIHPGMRGGGGFGKTQLARAFVHSLLRDWSELPEKCGFPDGVMEINLRAHNFGLSNNKKRKGNRLPPLSPEDACEVILTKLGYDENTLARYRRKGSDVLFKFYQDELRKRSVLLILDNAVDFAQVKPLLPEARSKEEFPLEYKASRAIVTSREKLNFSSGSGNQWERELQERFQDVEMAPWDPSMTGHYLRSRGAFTGQEPNGMWDESRVPLTDAQKKMALDIHKRTGGLPLAIEIIACLAVTSQNTNNPLHEVVSHLVHRSEMDPLNALLDLSLEGLNVTTRELHESLVVFPVQFDAAAAASIWGLSSVEDAAEQLEFLVRRGLLMKEWNVQFQLRDGTHGVPSYRMHDLIREHATSRFEKWHDHRERSAQDLCNFVAHYIGRQAFQNDVLQHRIDTLRPWIGRSNVSISALLFENDRFNFDLAAERYRQLSPEDSRLLLASLLSGAGTRLFDLLLSAKKRVRRIRAGLFATRRMLGLPRVSSKRTEKYTSLVAGLINTPSMREKIEQEHAQHLNSLGLAYRHQGARVRAREYFLASIRAARALKWTRGLACAWGNSGNIQQEFAGEVQDDLDAKERFLRRALRYHEHAEKFSEKCGDRLLQAIDWGNQAIVWMDLWTIRREDENAYVCALSLYDKRIKVALRREFNDRRGAGNGYGNKASAILEWLQRKLRDNALPEHQLPENLVRAKTKLLQYYKRAILHHRAGNNERGVAANEGNLARAYRLLATLFPGDRQKLLADALDHNERSLVMFRKLGDTLGERVALANLVALHLMAPSGQAQSDETIRRLREQLAEKESSLVAAGALKEEDRVSDAPAGAKLDRLRQLSDKYGKLATTDYCSADTDTGNEVIDECRKGYQHCLHLLSQALKPITQPENAS